MTPLHPSHLLQPDWTNIIRSNAAAAEGLRQLHPAQLELMYAQQWLKAAVPKVYGGGECTLPELVQLEEAMGWADGSMGWVFTLCAGAGWFGGFLDPALAAKIFADPKVCLAGSGAVTGTAIREKDGYRVNGHWQYASGVLHATCFTANCKLLNADASDSGEVLSFLFLRDEVTLAATWHTVGMVATGSDSFSVNDVWVKEDRLFKIDPAAVRVDSALYHFPFLQLAEATLAANMGGMAVHFFDAAKEIMTAKAKRPTITAAQKKKMENLLLTAQVSLELHRLQLHRVVEDAWEQCATHRRIEDYVLKILSSHSRALAKAALKQTDALYPYCGMAAANPDTAMNRVWRDIHTASQHSLLTFEE